MMQKGSRLPAPPCRGAAREAPAAPPGPEGLTAQVLTKHRPGHASRAY